MGRLLKTKIPATTKPATGKMHKEAKAKDRETRQKRKHQRDHKRKATSKPFAVGDCILLKQQKTTIKPPFDPKPYIITKIKGTQITASRGNQVKLRNMAHCKLLKKRPAYLQPRMTTGIKREYDSSEDEDDFINIQNTIRPPPVHAPAENQVHDQPHINQQNEAGNQPGGDFRRFSTRTRKPPARYTP